MNEKEIVLDIHGREYRVIIDAFTSEEAEVRVNGKKYTVGLTDLGMEKTPDVKPRPASSEARPPKAAAAGSKSRMHRPPSLGQENAITAPLPGQIVKIFVNEGDAVNKGEKVCMLEAMKMENEVNATVDGVIIDIKYGEGDSVNQGDVLFLVKPPEK